MHAAERDTERVKGLRRDYIEALQHEDVGHFKFVDEMRFKHLGLASTGPTPAVMAARWGGNASNKPCRCTTAPT
ncbi:MAG: hypothetical protein NVS3B25_23060 [Hymenobacter sp.]